VYWVYIAAKHGDLNTMPVKRLSDVEGKSRIESTRLQRESRNGFAERKLCTDHLVRRDFCGEIVGRQATEVMSSNADAKGECGTHIVSSRVRCDVTPNTGLKHQAHWCQDFRPDMTWLAVLADV
jgi:hypothetical protein